MVQYTYTTVGNSTASTAVTLDSTDAWSFWSLGSVTTGTTTEAWYKWSSGTVTSATCTAATWPSWIVAKEQNTQRARAQFVQLEEQRRRQEREYIAAQRKRERERKVARNRAKKILVENLSRHQRRSLEKLGYFDVEVGGRRFRIFNDRYQHNVIELDAGGKKIREYCGHTDHACPTEDHLLAQKLMLEACPQEFFRVANVWCLQSPNRPMISGSGQELVLP